MTPVIHNVRNDLNTPLEGKCDQMTQAEFLARLIPPYQTQGHKWLIHKEKCTPSGGILCDEMGLGKTLQTLSVICTSKPGSKTLVVVPKSIIHQWEDETNNCTTLRSCIFDKKEPFDINHVDIVFTTYQSLHSPECKLYSYTWNRLVLDEGHIIRNPNTIAYKHLSKYLQCDGPKWILTGTPVFNSTDDMIALLHFIGLDRAYVTNNLLLCQRNFILRRTRTDISQLSERLSLPSCEVTNIDIDPYESEVETYRQVFESQASNIEFSDKKHQNMAILSAILRTRQASIHPHVFNKQIPLDDPLHASAKLNTLTSLILHQPADEKTIIFCHFKTEMQLVKEHLLSTGKFTSGNVLCMSGDLNSQTRSDLFETFRKTAKVLVIQIQIGGVGLNLQEATRIYMISPSWNPATELQAIARAHRTGQTKKVFVKRLIYQDMGKYPSIDKVMIDLQQHKSNITAEVLEDERIKTKLPGIITNTDMKAFVRFFMSMSYTHK